MPRVRVEWYAGRTQQQRLAIAKRITQTFVDIAAVKPESVTVVFVEQDPTLIFTGGEVSKGAASSSDKK